MGTKLNYRPGAEANLIGPMLRPENPDLASGKQTAVLRQHELRCGRSATSLRGCSLQFSRQCWRRLPRRKMAEARLPAWAGDSWWWRARRLARHWRRWWERSDWRRRYEPTTRAKR